MTRRTTALALFGVAAVVVGAGGTGCSGDEPPAEPGVEVTDVVASPTPAGATVGAVSLTLRSNVDDELVAIKVDPALAAAAELHVMAPVEGSQMSSMDPLAGLALPAGEAVTIDGGDVHVMLEDLVRPLVDGDEFELTLDFELADDLTVTGRTVTPDR